MSKSILELELKLRKAWLKLLKAEVKRKEDKVSKWQTKVIELELMISKVRKNTA